MLDRPVPSLPTGERTVVPKKPPVKVRGRRCPECGDSYYKKYWEANGDRCPGCQQRRNKKGG